MPTAGAVFLKALLRFAIPAQLSQQSGAV